MAPTAQPVMTSDSERRPSPLSPVTSLSRRDGAIQEIRRAVVRGDLQPGEKLTEISLSTILGVSRPTVREAMNRLAQEGLMEQEPYRGLRVARLTGQEILDIAKARHALDMLAVNTVLEDTAGHRMAAVDDAWQEFERFELDEDPLVRHEAHLRFHRGIWLASENSMLMRFWPTTEANLTIALAQDQAVRSDPQRAQAVHHKLIDALHTKERARIENAFYQHTIESAEELIRMLDTQGGQE